MPVKSDEYNKVCVLTVEGDLSGDECGALRKLVEERINNRQIADFVVDLEKCGFFDSDGLETLLWIKRKTEDLFGQTKLVALDDNCRKILEITRLEHRFETHKDLGNALKTMR